MNGNWKTEVKVGKVTVKINFQYESLTEKNKENYNKAIRGEMKWKN